MLDKLWTRAERWFMKPLLVLSAVASSVSLAIGQGEVNFSAGSTSSSRISTNSVIGGPTTGLTSPGPGRYYFALFVADSTVTSAGTRTAFGLLDPLRTPGWSQVLWQPGNSAGL